MYISLLIFLIIRLNYKLLPSIKSKVKNTIYKCDYKDKLLYFKIWIEYTIDNNAKEFSKVIVLKKNNFNKKTST